MTKDETIHKILEPYNVQTRDLVNVVETHKNPARKLKGLLRLLQAGHTVKLAAFHIGGLLIDDIAAPWNVLDEWSMRRT